MNFRKQAEEELKWLKPYVYTPLDVDHLAAELEIVYLQGSKDEVMRVKEELKNAL